MNEKLLNYKNKIVGFWKERSTAQKAMVVGSVVSLIALLVIVSMLASKPNLVPLYSNLPPSETGQIKTALDSRGIKSEITDNGTTIMVPEAVVDTLLVELAAEGIPNNGNIDYSFFAQNSGFGMTEKEFQVLEKEAMQTELANLIKGIDGVNGAKVMLTLPTESIWVNQEGEQASASIVVDQQPGYRFSDQQINTLYHLVSKSVPNLPVENIVIMNQMFEHFDAKSNQEISGIDAFANNYQIQKQIEKDIQNQVVKMLGMMMGQDKVVVSVTADIDFTKEARTEDLVEPVDTEKMEGITISAEKIQETFTGNGTIPGGTVGAGNEGDIPNYAAENEANGDYEHFQERINKEVNRIKKEIVESPYEIRDLGIQVAVDPTVGTEEDENGELQPVLLTEDEQEALRTNIQAMLSNIVITSISNADNNLDTGSKISVTMQPFNGRPDFGTPTQLYPTWMYIAGAGVIVGIILGIIFMLRRRKKAEEVVEEVEVAPTFDIGDIDKEKMTESGERRKQLERMAKDKPDEFAKLLRTWLAED